MFEYFVLVPLMILFWSWRQRVCLIWGEEQLNNEKQEKSRWTRERAGGLVCTRERDLKKKKKHLFLIVCENGVLVIYRYRCVFPPTHGY